MAVSVVRVRHMVRKELKQLLRDPRSRPILFVLPLVQLVLFGYAVNTDVRHIRTAALDHDRTSASRELLEAFTASGYFDIVERPQRPSDIVRSLDRGRVMLGIEIPAGFARDLDAGRGVSIQLLVDGSDSNTATVAGGYALGVVTAFTIQRSGEAGAASRGLVLDARAWFNPSLESRMYNVPAVIGALLMLICLLLTSFSVVRERELGTLDQLRVSPITSTELILGKTIPVMWVGALDLALITVIATTWFSVPLRGSLVVLAAGGFLFILCGLSIGLLISTVSRTQQEAFLTMYLVFLPTLIFSGFFFPIESMPSIFQWISYANPMRYFLEIVRALFLKGAGLAELYRQFAVIAAMAVTGIGLAIRRFERSVA